MSELSELLNDVFQGNSEGVLRRFAGTPRINAQRGGLVEGKEAVEAWVKDTAEWFRGLEGEFTTGFDIESDRSVHDTSLMITTKDGRVDLPFVAVADRDGDKFKEIRTYHSTWPYTGGHTIRASPAPRGDMSELPKLFEDYIERLKTSDVDPILASFTEDGYVREPSGNRYKYQGKKARDDFYKGHIADAPPARFDLRTCTNGNSASAVEYAFAYGDAELVGGVCIMEYENGKIAAVRITDDVGV